MQIGNWSAARGYAENYRKIREHGLEEKLGEFNVRGYTVIPREALGAPDLLPRMRDAVLRIASERSGVPHSLDGDAVRGKYDPEPRTANQFLLYYLIPEDPVFQEAASNPVVLALLRHVLGAHMRLSSCAAFVKSKGDAYGPNLGLHVDAAKFPEPLPAPWVYTHVTNTNWVLTDYTEENGPLAVIPGSHRWGRHPRVGECTDLAVGVEAPAGSVILFHGYIWHGGLPKTTPGLRLSVNNYYTRAYGSTQELYKGQLSDEILENNSPEFSLLVGARERAWGWKDLNGPTGLNEDEDLERLMRNTV